MDMQSFSMNNPFKRQFKTEKNFKSLKINKVFTDLFLKKWLDVVYETFLPISNCFPIIYEWNN